jgi:hypothetical protein
MKRKFRLTIVALALLTIGFASGQLFQHGKSGYHYEVSETKNYESPMGLIRWSYVFEFVGMPFIDTGTTILEIDGKTIYKAKRPFQESTPFAKNVKATQDHITWDDGEYLFDLTLRRMKTDKTKPPLTAP